MNWNNIELPDKNIYFQDADSRIYNADCRDILPLIPDKSIDLVLTDPPDEATMCLGAKTSRNGRGCYWVSRVAGRIAK